MKVVLSTKSNFKNCNGIELEVQEISGNRVTCKIPRYGFNKKKEAVGNFTSLADFDISEVERFNLQAYSVKKNVTTSGGKKAAIVDLYQYDELSESKRKYAAASAKLTLGKSFFESKDEVIIYLSRFYYLENGEVFTEI